METQSSFAESINRAFWDTLRTHGDPLPMVVRAAPAGVDVEEEDGANSATVYLRDDGIEIRVGDLQLVVKHQHVVLMQSHPPYPIQRWTVLWEGDMT